ncbi:MAG: ATP synthase F1 subunit epsilon [Bacteroidetes bacterium]|nr:ATP synthase F1 subunit epsilon [Bacteroidota bacterium]
MKVEIINPDQTVFSGEADVVQLPGKDGSFEILNNHAPIISVLRKGKIKIVDPDKKTEFFEINGGVIEVVKNKVLILAE